MKFEELPNKRKKVATTMAIDDISLMYAENDIDVQVNKNSKEVIERIHDFTYSIIWDNLFKEYNLVRIKEF